MPKRIRPLQIYQSTMSKALERMIQTDDIQEVFKDVLNDVLQCYNAGRVVIMEPITEKPGFQTCIFEIDAPGVRTTMECMNYSFPMSEWRYKRMRQGKSVIFDDVDKLKKGKGMPRDILDKLGVRSHIAVPIFEGKILTNFLCIDINDRPYHWTEQDEKLVKDIANLIMMWRKQKKANKKISEEKDYLHTVMENIPVGLALYNPDGELTYTNEKLKKVFGFSSPDDIIDFNLFESKILTKDELESIKKKNTFYTFFDYGYGNKPTIKNRITGQAIKVMARYSKLYDNHNNLKAYLAAYVDRTQDTNIGNKVKELDGFMSVCAEYAKIGFAKVNVIDGIGFGTEQWFKNFNVNNDDGTHLYNETISRLHPDDRKRLMDFRNVAIFDPAVAFNKRMRVMKNDGSGDYDFVQMYSVVTNYAPQHGIVETSTICQNVNRQVEMERMLIEARDEAEKADKLKSAFLANMSHEIRTPLNAIVGFSQLLCENEISKEYKDEVMTIIETNNTLLLQLITDILDLAKLEAGTLEFIIKDTDVNLACKSVASSVKMRIKENVNLIIDCPEPNCHIMSDPNRLKQVLINFATNAAKFTEKGHVKIGYRILSKSRIRFYVEDTGIGIKKENKERVFERFVKLNKFQQGNGLGLQISREIVTKLGGIIGVESEEGKGSTFWFEVPTKTKI